MEGNDEENLNIYQRLNKVCLEINGYIRKDKEVGEGPYAYKAVMYDHVVAHIRSKLLSNGIDITANGLEQTLERFQNAKGMNGTRAIQKVEVIFTNIDKPEEKIYSIGWGMADDFGDKSLGKAFTYGVKAILLKKFVLETGEDEESYAITIAQDSPIDAYQASYIRESLDRLNKSPETLLAWIEKQFPGTGAESIEEIPRKYFNLVSLTLRKQARDEKSRQN